MANFSQELPSDLIKMFDDLAIKTPEMMGEMTKAGAEVVEKNVRSNLSKSFKSTDRLVKCLTVSKTYRTPSDDSFNNKVLFRGYLDAEKKHPAPLVAMAREYGTSRGEKRKPFFRKSFNKSQIESAMKQVEEKYLPKG